MLLDHYGSSVRPTIKYGKVPIYFYQLSWLFLASPVSSSLIFSSAAMTSSALGPSAVAILEHLEAEHRTLGRVLVTQNNQHRRTSYWKAFRRAHKITGRIIVAARSPQLPQSSHCLSDLSPAAQKLVHLGREVARRVTGAGFASLHAILLAGVATYVSDTLRLRDAMCSGVVE